MPNEEKYLYIRESYVNASKDYRMGDSDVYQTKFTNTKSLYRHCLREFGRCKSKVYIETKEGQVKQVGWIFEKRVKYDDSKDTFLQQTWIDVHDSEPERSIRYHYHKF